MTAPGQEPAQVYALVNEQCEIIYVGSTTTGVGARLDRHRRRQPWADEIAGALTLANCQNLGQAWTREAAEIKARRPRYNKFHNPDYQPLAIDRAAGGRWVTPGARPR